MECPWHAWQAKVRQVHQVIPPATAKSAMSKATRPTLWLDDDHSSEDERPLASLIASSPEFISPSPPGRRSPEPVDARELPSKDEVPQSCLNMFTIFYEYFTILIFLLCFLVLSSMFLP